MRTGVREGEPATPVAVYKFGSSVLEGAAGYRAAAAVVRREVLGGRRVVAVVSAVSGATDALLSLAGALSPGPAPHLVSRLLATGESASVALMAMALEVLGIQATALGAEALGLRTVGPLLEAEPYAVEEGVLHAALARGQAVVVPGFVGVDVSGEATLLGRGGSDWTALFLAQRLRAVACVLVKDTDGVYDADPKLVEGARRLERASWEEVLTLGGEVVQPRAVAWAREHRVNFTVASAGGRGTRVGDGAPVGVEVTG